MKPFIQQYCQISEIAAEHVRFEWDAVQILQQKKLSAILAFLKQEYRATGMELPASLLGTALLGPITAMMIQCAEDGRCSDMSLENLTVQLALYNGSSPYIQLKLNKNGYLQSQQFTDMLPLMIEHNLTKPISKISEAANVKPTLIWNQFGARLASAIESYNRIEDNEEILKTLRDYTDLIESLPGHLFGLSKNPFVHKPTYIESPYEPGSVIMMRSACCMFYKKENGQKCANCPARRK